MLKQKTILVMVFEVFGYTQETEIVATIEDFVGVLCLFGRKSAIEIIINRKRLGITVFQPRLKVCTFARTNYYEYGKQRQVQESP